MDRLFCTVMPYAWGSRSAIAELTGRPSPTSTPEAELWMGAHPVAPSKVRREGIERSLSEIIAQAPRREIGEPTVARFGPRLPFLLKVLAAASPLSLQAHPSLAQARAGFARENEAGIALNDPTRNYKDPYHKPELLCALTPFVARSGFRPIDEIIALFTLFGRSELDAELAPLQHTRDADGLAETFRRLMLMPKERVVPAIDALLQHCPNLPTAFDDDRSLALRLATLYPGDRGILSALLLKSVRLQPGEAIFLDAGNLHAYVEGTGVEIMASSDNVLRGGLTPKHIDVAELLATLDFHAAPPMASAGIEVDHHEVVYETPAAEFRLSRIDVRGSVTRKTEQTPEILLITSGSCAADTIELPQGACAFVSASHAQYTLTGTATVYRATTNV